MRRTNIRDHALRSEGAPYVGSDEYPWVRVYPNHGGGTGHALCECGATSGVLMSDGARKSWHADHKAQVRLAASSVELECPSCNTDDPADFRNGCEDNWHAEMSAVLSGEADR